VHVVVGNATRQHPMCRIFCIDLFIQFKNTPLPRSHHGEPCGLQIATSSVQRGPRPTPTQHTSSDENWRRGHSTLICEMAQSGPPNGELPRGRQSLVWNTWCGTKGAVGSVCSWWWGTPPGNTPCAGDFALTSTHATSQVLPRSHHGEPRGLQRAVQRGPNQPKGQQRHERSKQKATRTGEEGRATSFAKPHREGLPT